MNKINENPLIGMGISITMGAVGYLGGHAFKLILPSVSAPGYGLTLGLWAPISIAMYKLAEEINKDGGIFNVIFGILGGYFASWTATNLMGFSVSLIAPFVGVAFLVAVVAIVGVVAAPVFQVAFDLKKYLDVT